MAATTFTSVKIAALRNWYGYPPHSGEADLLDMLVVLDTAATASTAALVTNTAALAVLAAATGAANVGLADAAGYYTGATVELGLAEIGAKKPLSYATKDLVVKHLTIPAQTPSSGIYTLDASGDFSAITAFVGWRIKTAAASVANCAIPGVLSNSTTTINFHWLKSDFSTDASDATIAFEVTVIGTAA